MNRLTTADGESIDPDAVRTHSGYAAVVDVDYLLHPQVTYVCVDPERFGYLRIGGHYRSPEDERARAERQAREDELRDQLVTATEVRLTWLRQQLATQVKAKAWLDDALCQRAAGEHELFYPSGTAETLCALPAPDTTLTAKCATHRFVAVTIGALHELAYDPVDRDGEDVPALARFYDLLDARGYTLTEVEQAERDECERLLTRYQDSDAVHEANPNEDTESEPNTDTTHVPDADQPADEATNP